MKQDLATCTQALEEVTSQPIKYFRPPFGVTNPTIARAIRQAGYTPIGWNIRSLAHLYSLTCESSQAHRKAVTARICYPAPRPNAALCRNSDPLVGTPPQKGIHDCPFGQHAPNLILKTI